MEEYSVPESSIDDYKLEIWHRILQKIMPRNRIAKH